MHRAKLLIPVILAVAFLSSACVGFSEPRGWAEPVFDGDTVYVFVDRDEFVAIGLDDLRPDDCGGDVFWSFPDSDLVQEEEIDLEAVYGPPLFAGNRIILADFSGQMVALSAEGRFVPGRGSWRRDDVDGSIVGGATLAGDRFAFGTTEQRLYVRSVEDGGSVPGWPIDGRTLDGEIWSQPVVVGGTLYVGTMDGKLYAFDLETGQELWAEPFDADGAIADLAFIGDGILFVPTLRGEVWLVDAESGQARLADPFEAEGWVWTRPAVQDGIAYFGDFDDFVYAMELATGRTVWTYLAEDKVKAQPVIIGDVLIVGDEGGTVHFVELATGVRRNAVHLDKAGKIRAGLAEKEGFAWILGTDGRLYRADPEALTVFEPAREPATIAYTVAEGDSLAAIAESCGIPTESILELNPRLDPAELQEGDVILVPREVRGLP